MTNNARRLGLAAASLAVAFSPAVLVPTPVHASSRAASNLRASDADQVELPALPGRYEVGTLTRELTDHHRTDPFAPAPQDRSVMVQLWYPATAVDGSPPAPYMTPALAAFEENASGLPAGTLGAIGTHAHVDALPRRTFGGWPVVLFSPGSGSSRSLYTTMLEDLASQGFIIVAMDHPYDADAVEFPGGRLVLRDQPPDGPESNAVAVAVRAEDTSFVLSELPMLDGQLRGTMNLHRVGMFGHSMGGATTAAAMHTDPRLAAGVDLDGTLYGPVVDTGLSRPFLLMSSATHDRSDDGTWAEFWSHLSGWHRDLKLAGSGHLSYCDIAALVGPLHLTGMFPPEMVGTIDGDRAVQIEQTYLTAYFDRFLRHGSTPLLDSPDPDYPEVLFED
ncbi:hypothetical protein MRQ36_29590 [Micromonospora sp. R77]|uniref:alpha/beta hydrolase family protein n=1 Tax=Micromonospora sp. R77 TaxID=2925836 RepID=UPI001F6152C4|nr:hypothetical protein [Micromonospora sp. R77]MCI4066487.1 hypothetical protein [Micromonospora sp. R77]